MLRQYSDTKIVMPWVMFWIVNSFNCIDALIFSIHSPSFFLSCRSARCRNYRHISSLSLEQNLSERVFIKAIEVINTKLRIPHFAVLALKTLEFQSFSGHMILDVSTLEKGYSHILVAMWIFLMFFQSVKLWSLKHTVIGVYCIIRYNDEANDRETIRYSKRYRQL